MKKLLYVLRRRLWMLRHRHLGDALLKSAHGGDLAAIGWTASFEGARPVDADGRPLPWISYPAIHLLKTRLPADARVFEYGSGQSTAFFAERAQRVVSIEHDVAWAAEVRLKAPAHVELIELPLGDDYVDAALRFDAGSFDLVLIDGRKRVRCALQARRLLSPRGVLILDDAQREYYAPVRDALLADGMRMLELYGVAPGSDKHKLTTLYYRDGNLLRV